MALWRSALHKRVSERPRPRLKPRRATSLISALFAVGLVTGFSVAETADHSHAHLPSSAAPGTIPAPEARQAVTVPKPTSPTTTAPAAPPTTTPPPSVAASVAAPAPPGPCTPGNLSITTSAAAADYPPGEVVDITTNLRAVSSPCELVPVPAGAYSCGTSMVVDDASGSQVWPMPEQGEQCAQPSPTLLRPGYGENVTFAWNQQYVGPSSVTQTQIPPGQYQAFGTWTWSAGAGEPAYTVTAPSVSFTIQ